MNAINASEDTAPDGGHSIHAGQDLEAGMLAKSREWVDLFPWLRLLRIVRLAGSPPHLVLVTVILAAWIPGMTRLVGGDPAAGSDPGWGDRSQIGFAAEAGDQARPALPATLETLRRSLPSSLFEPLLPSAAWYWRVGAVVWTLLLWTPLALLLARQGALLSAGRELGGFGAVAGQALRRSPAGWLVAVIPALGVLLIGSGLAAAGWLERTVGNLGWLETPLAVGLLLLAIACGILALGANVAVPLGWCAIANEREPDPFDALSRGYEYLYRRPIQVVFYALVAAVPLCIIDGLARAVALSGSFVLGGMIGDGESPLASTVVQLLHYLPVVVSLTLVWGLVGGIYLLLRQDAGGQEPEDLWQPGAVAEGPLPTLGGAATTNQSG